MGRSFHFDEETGVMDTDQWVDGFYLGEDGAKVEDGFFTVDGIPICSMRMATGGWGWSSYP